MNNLLALLIAAEEHYRDLHWKSHGSPFYGDHKTYNKIYASLDKQIDELAETMILLSGRDATSALDRTKSSEIWLSKWQTAKTERDLAIQPIADLLTINQQLLPNSILASGISDYLTRQGAKYNSFLYKLQGRFS